LADEYDDRKQHDHGNHYNAVDFTRIEPFSLTSGDRCVQVLRLNQDIEEKEQQRRYLPLLDPERADLDAQIDELQQQKADLQAASRQVAIQVQHSPTPAPKNKN
jgi:hypothetical protein